MFTRVVVRTSKNSSSLTPLIRFNIFSSTVSPEPKNNAVDSDTVVNVQSVRKKNLYKRNNIVKAAFASIQTEMKTQDIHTPSTDHKLENAVNIDELLSVSEGSGVSRRHALKVVSILSNWSNAGHVQIQDFENDPRFLRLCRILTKPPSNAKSSKSPSVAKSDDLSVVLSVTADEEAAQLIGNITVPQMIKVMSTLSLKKRRSTLLLRTLAFNITRKAYQLNLKEASDLLFSMATLNFPDENLLAKISSDVCLELTKKLEKSSVVGSILTSVGLMKYKDPVLLDSLCDWILKNHSMCRNQDIYSLIMTLAVVNFVPINVDKLLETFTPYLLEAKTSKFTIWLEIVWSLVLLNKVNAEHISSILDDNFLVKFQENSPLSSKLKLLNIDAAAQFLIVDYNGPRLPEKSTIREIKPSVSKTKSEMVGSVIDTFKNLIQSEELLKTNRDTGMGFYIDAECLLDKKHNPIPWNNLENKSDLTKVAVMAQDFHDMTLGKIEPTGITMLCENLLKANGYTILSVPYTEYKPQDNLIQRVKYIETKLKTVVVL